MDSKIISPFNYDNEKEYISLLEYFFVEEYKSLIHKSFHDELYLFEYQNYSKMSLLLSNQLFKTIDKENNESIAKDTYIKNQMIIYTGSIDSKIHFLFSFMTVNDNEYIYKEDMAVLFRHLFISVTSADELKRYSIQYIDDLIESFFKKTVEGSQCLKDEFILIITKKDPSLFFMFYYVMYYFRTFSKEILDYLKYQINRGETNKKKAKTVNEITIFKGRNDYRTYSDYKTSQLFLVLPEENQTFKTFIDKASCYLTPPCQSLISFFECVMSTKNEIIDNDDSSFSELDELALFENEMISTKSNFDEEGHKRKNTLSSLNGLLPFDSKETLATTFFNSFHKEHMNRKESDNQSLNLPFSPQANNKNMIEFQDVSLSNLSPSQEKKYSKNKECIFFFNEEEIMLFKEDQYLKYKLLLNSSVIFLSKWNNKTFRYTYKKLIPIRNLYIKSSDKTESTIEGYYLVELISFIYLPQKEFELYFLSQDAKTRFIQFIQENNLYRSIEDYYSISKEIGKGNFSQVFQGKNKMTNEKVAIKVIARSIDKKEINIMKWETDLTYFIKKYSNDNVGKVYDIFETITHVYIVMEYFEIGSLTSYLQHNESCLPSQTVYSIIAQLLNALKYFEHFGIIHRDIKADNILIKCYSNNETNLIAKISDFGLGQMTLPTEKRKENYGTLLFAAPEILLGVEYDLKVDVWSLGVLSYYLEYTYLPFNIKSNLHQREISHSIISNPLIIPKKYNHEEKDEEVQRKIVHFIQLALQKDWKNRSKVSSIDLESI